MTNSEHSIGACDPDEMSARAYALREIPRELVQEGFTRTAIKGDASLVTVNWLEPGLDLSAQHDHTFDQLSFVLSGRMTFFVADRVFDLTAPAVIHIPAGIPHGASIPEDGEVVLNIDVFAPVRQDYLYLTDFQKQMTIGGIEPLAS